MNGEPGPHQPSQRDRPARKHLRRLERVFPDIKAPVYLITVNVKDHERVLADPAAAQVVIDALGRTETDHGWLVGRYVVMPSHVHFFTSPAGDKVRSLSSFLGFWKRATATRIRKCVHPSFAWQREFFDHLLRRAESYAAKWEYVRLNPVRARLVEDADEWPHQGEIHVL